MKITIKICDQIALELDSSMNDDRQLLKDTLHASVEFAESRMKLGELMDIVQQSSHEQDKRSQERHKQLVDEMDVQKAKDRVEAEMKKEKQIGLGV